MRPHEKTDQIDMQWQSTDRQSQRKYITGTEFERNSKVYETDETWNTRLSAPNTIKNQTNAVEMKREELLLCFIRMIKFDAREHLKRTVFMALKVIRFTLVPSVTHSAADDIKDKRQQLRHGNSNGLTCRRLCNGQHHHLPDADSHRWKRPALREGSCRRRRVNSAASFGSRPGKCNWRDACYVASQRTRSNSSSPPYSSSYRLHHTF